MRSFIGATLLVAAGAWFSGMTHAQAQTTTSEPVVVVEMFTSQGCSSCPPADEFFSMLVDDPRVIPLALHVDYWDYIGWADVFAKPQYTDRQKAYARAVGSRTIYTPQMIVDGQDRVEGHQPDQVESLIQRHLASASGVSLQVDRVGRELHIRADSAEPLRGALRVQLVRYRPSETVEIERGENAGRTVTYHNIVTSWQPLGEWSGQEPLTMEADAPGTDPAVVILQSAGPAEIIAAARVN